MKLLRNYLFQTLLVVAAVLTMHSCSCGGPKTMEGKLDKISDKAQIVLTVNIEKLFEQLDVTVSDKGTVELPSYINKLVSAFGGRDKKILRQFTDFKGIDFTQAVFVGYDLDDNGYYDDDKDKWVDGDQFFMMVFNVTDEDDFIKSVKETDSHAWSGDSEGYAVVTTADGHGPKFLIKSGLAYMVKDEVSAKDLDRRLDAAKDTPLASWKKDYLSSADYEVSLLLSGGIFDQMPREFSASLTVGMDVDLMTASIGVRGDLNGPTATVTGTLLDKDGNPVKLDIPQNINTDVLKYVNENDLAVAALGIKSLDRFQTILQKIGMGPMSSETRSSINRILAFKDLTAMFATGPLSDKPFMDWNNPAEELRYTLAVTGEKAEIKDLYGYACDMMEMASNDSVAYMGDPILGKPMINYPDNYSARIMTSARYNWETDSYEYEYLNVYARLAGNTMIVSNAPITEKGSKNFEASEFADKTSMFKVIVPKNLPNLGGFKLPNGFVLSAWGGDTAEGTVQFSITGTQEKLVPALVNMAMSFGVAQ